MALFRREPNLYRVTAARAGGAGKNLSNSLLSFNNLTAKFIDNSQSVSALNIIIYNSFFRFRFSLFFYHTVSSSCFLLFFSILAVSWAVGHCCVCACVCWRCRRSVCCALCARCVKLEGRGFRVETHIVQCKRKAWIIKRRVLSMWEIWSKTFR